MQILAQALTNLIDFIRANPVLSFTILLALLVLFTVWHLYSEVSAAGKQYREDLERLIEHEHYND